jgi:hypothetical protein
LKADRSAYVRGEKVDPRSRMALSYRRSTHSTLQSQWIRRSSLKKHNNSAKKSEPTSKRAKSRGPVLRDTKDVLAELLGKLKAKLDPKRVGSKERRRRV